MKKAFTLAEVLITLGIIGVVAALTMPSLIQNYKKHSTISRLKNALSLIQNAIKMAETKQGQTSEWEVCTDTQFVCTKLFFEKYLAPELNIIKSCVPSSDECWARTKTLSGNLYPSTTGGVSAILSNGMSMYMWYGGETLETAHLQIWFDLDGPKRGKNTIASDTFGIKATFIDGHDRKGANLLGNDLKIDNQLETLKYDADHGCYSLTGQFAGRYCGALIQQNSWQIPSDYPVKF